ncbi:hypothetical protein FG93_02540 [Bosea sp. LC85]|uniref:hypothetical protein n=1 Tax=Bosea sp. LC85 TaxID=1502851 RepID=UPI0004E2E191|nr:hypothetical protein [Bosea sp. LC85]KFC70784.1 hypothetical protein FG93_02540 [Bosea sp. LC85]
MHHQIFRFCKILVTLGLVIGIFGFDALAQSIVLRGDDGIDLRRYRIGDGYDIENGDGKPSCFQTTIIPSNSQLSRFKATLVSEEFQSRSLTKLIKTLDVQSSAKYGIASGKGKFSTASAKEESLKTSETAVSMVAEWIVFSGLNIASIGTKNAIGENAFNIGLGEFFQKCGYFVAVEEELGIRIIARVNVNFNSRETKKKFERKWAASTAGEFNSKVYGDYSLAVGGTNEIFKEFENNKTIQSITAEFSIEAKNGTIGVGDAIKQLPTSITSFEKIWSFIGELAKGRESDPGRPESISFVPIHKFLPNAIALEKYVDFGLAVTDFRRNISFAQGARALHRRLPSIANFVSDRSNDVLSTFKADEINSDFILLDYIAASCSFMRTHSVSLIRTVLCGKDLFSDFSIDRRLYEEDISLKAAAAKCFLSNGVDIHLNCSVDRLVASQLIGGLYINKTNLSAIIHELAPESKNAVDIDTYIAQNISLISDALERRLFEHTKNSMYYPFALNKINFEYNIFTLKLGQDDIEVFYKGLLNPFVEFRSMDLPNHRFPIERSRSSGERIVWLVHEGAESQTVHAYPSTPTLMTGLAVRQRDQFAGVESYTLRCRSEHDYVKMDKNITLFDKNSMDIIKNYKGPFDRLVIYSMFCNTHDIGIHGLLYDHGESFDIYLEGNGFAGQSSIYIGSFIRSDNGVLFQSKSRD